MLNGEVLSASRMNKATRTTLARIAALLVVIGISLYIFSIRDQAAKLALYGYPGVFILTFLAYGTVLFPPPGVAVVFAMGAVLNPLLVGVISGFGAALGELIGYLAGFSGQGVAERSNRYEKLYGWMQRNGSLTIFVLAALPNPFFDIGGIIAGALRMPYSRFLLFCWLGETIKMTTIAYMGGTASKWLTG